MKKFFLPCLVAAMCLLSIPAFAQTENQTKNKTQKDTAKAEKDSTLLGLPGDNLNLYAVIDLFQKSKTIEEFEKTLNLEKTGINNLDLNLDNKVDFIKVITKKDGDNFTFILQVDVTKIEKQDVAVILVSRDKDKKVTMQIVGDKELYGKDYIVEPTTTTTPSVTANPGYTGSDTTVVVNAPAKTTVVVVESAPIVQYVYSPAYAPYAPPYYYGYYPPYYAVYPVVTMGLYIGMTAAFYGGYHGGYGYHGNTTVVHNHNTYNNYNNNSRNTSNTVRNNKGDGSYSKGNNASTRPSNQPSKGGSGARPSQQPSGGGGGAGGARPSQQPSGGAGGAGGTRPSTQPSGGGSAGGGARPSTQPSTGGSGAGGARPSTQPTRDGGGSSARPSTQPASKGGGSGYSNSGSSRGSGGSSRSGGYSGGGSRSGGFSGGGRGGGGRGGGGRR